MKVILTILAVATVLSMNASAGVCDNVKVKPGYAKGEVSYGEAGTTCAVWKVRPESPAQPAAPSPCDNVKVKPGYAKGETTVGEGIVVCAVFKIRPPSPNQPEPELCPIGDAGYGPCPDLN